jgi:hypothetical protein
VIASVSSRIAVRTNSTLGRLRLEFGQLCSVERHFCILSSSSATLKSNNRVLPCLGLQSKRERLATLFIRVPASHIEAGAGRQRAKTSIYTQSPSIIVHNLQDNSRCGPRVYSSLRFRYSNRKSLFLRTHQLPSQSKYRYCPCSYSSVTSSGLACRWNQVRNLTWNRHDCFFSSCAASHLRCK